MDNKKAPKNAKIFECEKCDFKCCKISDLNRHFLTDKHKKITLDNKKALKSATPTAIHICHCGKEYRWLSGLSKHKKHCINNIKEKVEDDLSDKDLIIMLIKDNKEIMQALVDMSKTIQQPITNNTITNTNSNNTSFNLNVYLNETCKNAMNITDFVNSIKPTLSDLEYTGKKGYIEGISNIILNSLKALDTINRPIHCSDLKREVLYIKDNDVWEKDDEEKLILIKAIKTIANENIKNINEWKIKNPGCTDPDSKKNDLWLKIVSNSMCGLTKEETDKNISKIITNIAKEVVIRKMINGY